MSGTAFEYGYLSQERAILEFYRDELIRLKITPQRGGVALQHCAWMVEQALTFNVTTKMNRWIGFIQGVFWQQGIYTIDQMRQHVIDATPPTDDASRLQHSRE